LLDFGLAETQIMPDLVQQRLAHLLAEGVHAPAAVQPDVSCPEPDARRMHAVGIVVSRTFENAQPVHPHADFPIIRSGLIFDKNHYACGRFGDFRWQLRHRFLDDSMGDFFQRSTEHAHKMQ